MGGSGDTAPLIHTLGWRSLVNIMPQPLHPPGKNTSTHSTGGGVSSRAGLEDLEMRKIAGLCRDLNPGSPSP